MSRRGLVRELSHRKRLSTAVWVPQLCGSNEAPRDLHPIPDGEFCHPASTLVHELLDGLEGVAATVVVDVADGSAVEVG